MMQYPTIGRYIETLLNPEGLFRSLSGLFVSAPVEFSAGAYGVVFRVEVDGRPYALKCFTRHQPGRADAYRRIVRSLNRARSEDSAGERHLVAVEWLDEEMFVFDDDGHAVRYPVLLMEWAEGETLTKRMAAAVAAADPEELGRLSAAFDRLALWLLAQPFAHGDLKPDNLIVRPDGELTLVDYDGLYLPDMAGERARENGTEGFRSPGRGEGAFDERIDDFSIALMSLTLRVLARWPELYGRFRPSTGMLFDPSALVAGRCPVADFLRQTEWTADPLLEVVKRGEARIERLAELLTGHAAPESAYDYCGEAGREGIRLVRRGGKYGFATGDGTLVGECRYDRAREFAEGAAAVCLEGRWGFVGPDGSWLREPEYDDCGDFSRRYRAGQRRRALELCGRRVPVAVAAAVRRCVVVFGGAGSGADGREIRLCRAGRADGDSGALRFRATVFRGGGLCDDERIVRLYRSAGTVEGRAAVRLCAVETRRAGLCRTRREGVRDRVVKHMKKRAILPYERIARSGF